MTGPSGERGLIDALFPFHFSFGDDFRLTGWGRSFARLFPGVERGEPVSRFVTWKRPYCQLIEHLRGTLNQLHVLELVGRPVQLRAQLLELGGEWFVLGSPWITSSDQLDGLHLSLADFAQHDAVLDYMMLVQTQRSSLSETQEFAARLKAEKARAEALARAKSDFLAHMSHEIRTPLNAVLGFTGLMLEGGLSAEQEEHARQVRLSGETLLTTINNILDFSKFEAGEVSLESAPFDLYAVLDDAVQLAAYAAQKKHLSLSIHYPVGLGRVLTGDAGRLRQVVVNLVTNAVKFTDEGSVVVRARAEPGWLVLEVEDSGPGIAPEKLEGVFSPFVQAGRSSRTRLAGTGLGLAISRRLAEAMGGTLTARSALGVGSTFELRIPGQLEEHGGFRAQAGTALLGGAEGPGRDALELMLQRLGWVVEPYSPTSQAPVLVWRSSPACPVPGTTPQARVVEVTVGRGAGGALKEPLREEALLSALHGAGRLQAEAPVLLRGASMRVLVVDDLVVNQRLALSMLTRLGHRGEAVSSGHEALRNLEAIPYDLVLMDCSMPDLDGFETTRRLRKREAPGRRLPIVAMTAQVLDGDRQRALESGMDDFLAKPVTTQALAAALARNQPALDEAQLGEILAGGDARLLGELARSFERSSQRLLTELGAAAAAGDLAACRSAAHALRGSAATLGIACCEEACWALEHADTDSRLVSLAEPVLEELERQLQRGMSALWARAMAAMPPPGP